MRREAYTDGAVHPSGRAGWGVLIAGQPEHRAHGVLDSRDPMVAELWAVRVAVLNVPRDVALTVHTDAQSLPALLEGRKAGGREDLNNLAAKVVELARRREVQLACRWQSRETGLQQQAHALALAGRERGRRHGEAPQVLVHSQEGDAPGLELLVRVVTPRMTREVRVAWAGDTASETAAREALALLDPRQEVHLQAAEVPAALQALQRQALVWLQQEVRHGNRT